MRVRPSSDQPSRAALRVGLRFLAPFSLGLAALAVAAAAQEPDTERLFRELARPGGDGWVAAQSDIERAWSHSGSAALDLLLQRGEAALDAGDAEAAIGHLTALTDQAPDFPAGWAARAAALYLAGQPGPAAADLAITLGLEPRHWGALTQLGTMLEELGDGRCALAAYHASLAINPHQPEAEDGVARLTAAQTGRDA